MEEAMKNGIICKEDGDALFEIYRAINIDGSLNRNLTMDEMVFIFALGQVIKENFRKKRREKYMDYIGENRDDLTKAVYGLDVFTKNWCMNCKKTKKQDDLVFRCGECKFSTEKGHCLIKEFAYEHQKKHKYPLGSFGCMSR
jgi:hypothetical protein